MSTTLTSIRESVRERADMQHSEFVSDSELDSYINNSYKELYDLIVSRFEDYYSVRYITTVGIDAQIPLPEDFYKLRGVDLNRDGGDNWITVSKWMFAERNQANRTNNRLIYGVNDVQYRAMGDKIEFLPVSSAPGTYRIWYVPKTPTLKEGVLATAAIQNVIYTAKDVYADGNLISVTYTSGATPGSEVVTVVGTAISVQISAGVSTAQQVYDALAASQDALDLVSIAITGVASTVQNTQSATFLAGGVIQVDLKGVNGWDEYVIIDAAIKCLIKEESDVQVLLLQKQQMLKRIEDMAANRDAGDPERVSDTSLGYGDNWGGFGYGGR